MWNRKASNGFFFLQRNRERHEKRLKEWLEEWYAWFHLNWWVKRWTLVEWKFLVIYHNFNRHLSCEQQPHKDICLRHHMCHINFTMACVFSWNICSDSKRDAVYRHLSCLSNFVVCFLSFMMHFVLCLLFFAVIPFVTQQIAYCCSLVSALRLFSFHLFTLNVCCWYSVRSHVHNTMNMLIKKIIPNRSVGL